MTHDRFSETMEEQEGDSPRQAEEQRQQGQQQGQEEQQQQQHQQHAIMIEVFGNSRKLEDEPEPGEGEYKDEKMLYDEIMGEKSRWGQAKMVDNNIFCSTKQGKGQNKCFCVARLFYEFEIGVEKVFPEGSERKQGRKPMRRYNALTALEPWEFKVVLPVLKEIVRGADILEKYTTRKHATFVKLMSVLKPVPGPSFVPRFAMARYSDVEPFCTSSITHLVSTVLKAEGRQNLTNMRGFSKFFDDWLNMRKFEDLAQGDGKQKQAISEEEEEEEEEAESDDGDSGPPKKKKRGGARNWKPNSKEVNRGQEWVKQDVYNHIFLAYVEIWAREEHQVNYNDSIPKFDENQVMKKFVEVGGRFRMDPDIVRGTTTFKKKYVTEVNQ